MTQHFGDILATYIDERQRSTGQLAGLSGVPKHTIVSWREGRVKRPRSLVDVLKVAQALNLTLSECNRLLAAAGKPDLSQLKTLAQDDEDEALLEALSNWQEQTATATTLLPPVPMTAPRSTAPFVNRTVLLDKLQSALGNQSVCALWGMGGIGKTEIAKVIAGRSSDDYPDGILWADLPGVDGEHTSSAQRISSILGNWLELCGWQLGNDGGEYESLESRSRVLRTILSQRKILMVLNDATTVDEIEWFLPPPVSESSLLLTTRNSRVARAHAEIFEVSRLTLDESVELLQEFVDKERLFVHEESVEKLARLLDGHPLALSIVGSDLEETRTLTVSEYCELLEDERLRLAHLSDWENGSKDVRATFELSYRRMQPESQWLLMALSLFNGNEFLVEAVAAAASKPIVQVKRALGRLCSLALLEEVQGPEARTNGAGTKHPRISNRYRLHRLVRAFAAEKRFDADEDWYLVSKRIAHYYVQYVAENQAQPFTGLAVAWENILGAIEWLSDMQEWELLIKMFDGLTAISMGLAGFLDGAGHWQMAVIRLEELLAQSGPSERPFERAEIQIRLAHFYQRLSQHEKALAALSESEAQLFEYRDEPDISIHLMHIYQLRSRIFEQTDRQAALEAITQAIATFRNGDATTAKHEEGFLLIRHGSIVGQLGQLDEALDYSQQGLALLSDEPTVALTSGLTNVGIIHDIQGRSEEAIRAWREAMISAEAIGDLMRQGTLWNNIGIAESQRGQLHDAIKADMNALNCYQPFDFVEGQTRLYHNIGADYCLLRNFELATTYLNRAESLATEHALSAYMLPILVNQLRLAIDMEQELNIIRHLWQKIDRLRATASGLPHQREISRLGVELALREGDLVQANSLIATLLEETDVTQYEMGLTYRLYAILLDQLGQHEEARNALSHSATSFSQINKFEYARTLLALGLHYHKLTNQGNDRIADEGRTALDEARSYFVTSRYHAYLELFPENI